MCHPSLCCLAASVPSRLEVEGTLVLQPPPIPRYTANLLAIVVWRRVRKGRGGRVDSVSLDAAKETGIFLCGCQSSHPHVHPRTKQPTAVNSASTPRYARLKTWLPKMGPTSHPTAIMPNVLSPINMNGSRPPSCTDSVAS
jgi:hypothetical protein